MDVWKTMEKVYGFLIATFVGLPIALAFVIWLADGTQRPQFNDSHILSVRYIFFNLLFLAFLIPGFYVAKHRAVGAPLTWGEAMVAALYVFFLLTWLYGVIPHEFLTWADSELNWRQDKKVIGPEGSWATWWSFWKKIPLTVDKRSIRDVVVVVIYVVGLGGLMWSFSAWTKRGAPSAAAALPKASTYGRPLVADTGKS